MKTSGPALGFVVGLYLLIYSQASVGQGQPFQDLQRQIDGLNEQIVQLKGQMGSQCPPDSVRAGTVCIDKYEMSIWETTDRQLIQKIQNGTVTLADLHAAGAIQHGLGDTPTGDDYGPGCPANAAGCKTFYAVSVKGVRPSGFANWFQAAAAARNSGKRLPTNAEWQVAALGTPDGGETYNGELICNTGFGPDTAATGSHSRCVSDVGAYDMVGNIIEYVADWVPRSTGCASWNGFSDNEQCLAGAAEEGPPGAIARGGTLDRGGSSGPFWIQGINEPTAKGPRLGYRAAR